MLIEFFGLPGSGKSTLSRLAADRLRARGIIVDEITYDLDHGQPRLGRRLAKFAHSIRYAVMSPRRAFSDLIRIAATRQARPTDLGKSIFNWMFIASLASRKRSATRITILDQGVAQALWSIGFAAQREDWLDLLLAETHGAALMPDLVIQVRADIQTIGGRLATRERAVSRMDAFARDRHALQRAGADGDPVLHRLRSGGVPVIEVDNDDPGQLVSSARVVADAIMIRLNEPSTAPCERRCHGDRVGQPA